MRENSEAADHNTNSERHLKSTRRIHLQTMRLLFLILSTRRNPGATQHLVQEIHTLKEQAE